MTNGALSTHEKTKRYRDKRLAAGYSRVTVWFPPEIDKLLEDYAFKDVMLSKSAAVEEIVKDFLIRNIPDPQKNEEQERRRHILRLEGIKLGCETCFSEAKNDDGY